MHTTTSELTRSRPTQEEIDGLNTPRQLFQRSMMGTEQYQLDLTTHLKEQGNKCASCKATDPEGNWFVDYNQETGRVFGVLCHSCNNLIGVANGSVEYLEKQYYLKWISPSA